jgi:rubrerythrin
MFWRVRLWWRLRQVEKKLRELEQDLKLFRDRLREHPEDESFLHLFAPMENLHRELLAEKQEINAERTARLQGNPFRFSCSFCGRQNESYVPPIACEFCGKDVPSDLKRTGGQSQPTSDLPQ